MSEAFTGLEGGWSGEPIQPRLPPPEPGDAARSVTPPRPGDESMLSSVEITENAKGDARVRVKVYARSNEPTEVERAVEHGLDLYKRARGQLRGQAP